MRLQAACALKLSYRTFVSAQTWTQIIGLQMTAIKLRREARPSQCDTKVVRLNLLPSGGGLGRGKREPSMLLLRKTDPNDWACEGISQMPPCNRQLTAAPLAGFVWL